MTVPYLVPVFFLALAMADFSFGQSNPYCSIATCTSKPNTLCLYSNTTWGSTCLSANPSASVVSAADITTILDVHNSLRRKVAKGLELRGQSGAQPTASNMRKMVWDEELAVMAQTHAQQCVFQHDKCRDVSRFQVGQNIYMSMSTAPLLTSNWNASITKWYDEVVYMTSAYVTNFPSSPPNVIGHYTQVVWATSYKVGCGVSSYKATDSYPYKRLYVCNYGPAGNWINLPVYSQGTPGSACPSGTVNSDGLCA